MRFIRLASLMAGVALLLTAVADVIARRAELSESRDRTLESAAMLTGARADAGIARIAAVLAVAPADASADELAGALGVATCTAPSGSGGVDDATCSDPVPVVGDRDIIARAVGASVGRDAPVAALGRADGEGVVVVVAVGRPTGMRYAVAPLDDLLEAPPDVVVGVVPGSDGPEATAATVGDERVASVALATEFVRGNRRVQASVPAAVGLSADERWLIGAQLVIGVGLVMLAAGTFLAEHRALHRRATIDALTGLANRAEFERRARAALARARRAGAPVCVMVVDLDRFKEINDTAGHHVGDRVLAEAAARLSRAVRESDVVGRWGGDEFVVLLEGVGDAAAVAARADAIERALGAAILELDHDSAGLTASVGAALFPRHGGDLDTLVRAADAAMYAAKAAGAPHRLAVS